MKKARIVLVALMVAVLLVSTAGCGRLLEGAIDRAIEEGEKAMESLDTSDRDYSDPVDQADEPTEETTPATDAPQVSLDWPTDKMGGLSKPSGTNVTDIFSMMGSTSVSLQNFDTSDASSYVEYLEGQGFEKYMESMDGTSVYYYLSKDQDNIMVLAEGDDTGSIVYSAYDAEE